MSKNHTQLGNSPSDDAGKDAVHVAIVPATAGQTLNPGQRVSMTGRRAYVDDNENSVGVVDPFRTEPVRMGDRFWLCVIPNTVTDLRHEWTHPAFPDDAPDVVEEDDDGCSGC